MQRRHFEIVGLARQYWRYFVVLWLFPMVLFVLPFLRIPRGGNTTFFILAFLLFVGIGISQTPRSKGQLTLTQTALLATVVPLLIWVVLVGALAGIVWILWGILRLFSGG
jgi:hypothetical protein